MPPLGLNPATLVGHGTVRTAMLGDEARAPRPDEFGRMAALVAEAMAVVVNGVPVVLNGRPTGATPGRVLRCGRPDAPVAG